jgi:serine protease AprX
MKRSNVIFIFAIFLGFSVSIIDVSLTNVTPNDFQYYEHNSVLPKRQSENPITLTYDAQDYIGLTPSLWDENLTGKGVTVAILDTGIYPYHDVFTNDGARNWNSRIKAFYDETLENITTPPYDIQWHGTWAASILGGNSSVYRGVAPEVNFVVMKLFYINDSEVITTIPILSKAVDWLIENKETYQIKIVSMSFGSKPEPNNLADLSKMDNIVSRLVEEGMLVVAAAGNNGNEGIRTINAPGSAKSILTVGGVDYQGNVYDKSSKGPTYDESIKPDVCAPALSVTGAYPSPSNSSYAYASGTSASTPFVAGLAALMLERDPDLSPFELKNIISLTSYRSISPEIIKDNVQGWGIIQGYAALNSLEDPLLFQKNSILNFDLNENYTVYCQPISLNPGQYYLELSGDHVSDAEMYLFDTRSDDFGNPLLLANTINVLNFLNPTRRMGVSITEGREYYLVVKLKEKISASYSIKLVEEYRNSIFLIILIGNLVGIGFIFFISKKK